MLLFTHWSVSYLWFYADSDFAIKCGGPQIRSTEGIIYERENETLGPATYFVTDTSRWAVSNVGLFRGSNNPVYTKFVSNQFSNTLNTELFQTARISPSSLRYYGLGLENGFYNITLQFAETAIQDSATSWESLGRRVFDIYIQVLLYLSKCLEIIDDSATIMNILAESSLVFYCTFILFFHLNIVGESCFERFRHKKGSWGHLVQSCPKAI